jgi:hypothetical protein
MPGGRLTLHDREVIERGVRAGWTATRIAEAIGRHRTTVARDLGRGTGARQGRPSRAPAATAGPSVGLSGGGGAGAVPPAGASAEAVQAGRGVRRGGGGAAGGELVAAADLGVAAGVVPGPGGLAGESRDDLPVAVRAGPRRTAQGAHRAPAQPAHCPQAPGIGGAPGQADRDGADQRSPRGGLGSRRARPLGRATCSWAGLARAQ